ncbi:hypothetical protein TcWFU_002724 [Taenia crassiceps]|uniref:Uncharacterized protein n=1 Tax=Taenia crassiceps TaxID=6207 RepID=A0ABR4QPT6_9CEST
MAEVGADRKSKSRSKRLGRRRWRKSWNEIVAGNDGRAYAYVRTLTLRRVIINGHDGGFGGGGSGSGASVCASALTKVSIKLCGARGTPSFALTWTALNVKALEIVRYRLLFQPIIGEARGGREKKGKEKLE